MPGGVALTTMTHALAWTLVHSLWQGTLAALIYYSVRRIVRDPARRYRVGCACWSCFVTLQVLTLAHCHRWAGGESIDLPLRLSIATDDAAPPVRELTDSGAYRPVELPDESWMLKAASAATPLVGWIIGIWLAGSAVGVIRYLVAMNLIASALKRSHPLESERVAAYRRFESQLRLQRSVKYVQTEQSSVPATFGWLWPVVIIPVARRLKLDRDHLDAMVLHELAHIRRRDSLTHRVRRLLGTLFFFHPALRWMDAWMTEDSEEAADEIASRAVGDEKVYAEALISLEKARGVTLLLGANGGSLRQRLLYLIASPHAKGKDASALSVLVVGLCAMLLLMVCGEAVALAASPEQRTLAWVRERNLAEASLAALDMESATDHATPAIRAAVGELEARGTVERRTLDALADALHKGVPADRMVREFRGRPPERDERSYHFPGIGSARARAQVAGLLTGIARATENPGAQAHYARAAYALLVLDFAAFGSIEPLNWIAIPDHVAMLHLDPTRQRQIDYAATLHGRRGGALATIAPGIRGANAFAVDSALTNAAYRPDVQLCALRTATPEEIILIRGFLRRAPAPIRDRWLALSPQLAE